MPNFVGIGERLGAAIMYKLKLIIPHTRVDVIRENIIMSSTILIKSLVKRSVIRQSSVCRQPDKTSKPTQSVLSAATC